MAVSVCAGPSIHVISRTLDVPVRHPSRLCLVPTLPADVAAPMSTVYDNETTCPRTSKFLPLLFYRLKCVAFCCCCSSCLCLSERTGMHAYKKAHVCTNISFHQLTFHHFAVPTRLLSRRSFAGGGPLHDGCRRVTRRTTDKINASSFSSISACPAVFPSAAHSPKLC